MNSIRKLLNFCQVKIKFVYDSLPNIIKQQIFPGIYATIANKKIDEGYDKLNKKNVKAISSDINTNEALLQLKEEFQGQMDRKKTIEEKAKSILATISISITAITFSLNYETVIHKNSLSIISLVVLILSVFCFIMGTIRAIQTINIRPFNVSQTESKETDNEIELIPIGDESKRIQELLKAKLLNDKIILKLGNYAYAAYNLVRNGIILFALYFIVALVKKTYNNAVVNNCEKMNDTVTLVVPFNVKMDILSNNLLIKSSDVKKHFNFLLSFIPDSNKTSQNSTK